MHPSQPQKLPRELLSSPLNLFRTQIRFWLGLIMVALLGVLLFGLRGFWGDDQEYQRFRVLDRFSTQILDCRFLVSDLHRRWSGLASSPESELEPTASLTSQVEVIQLTARQVQTCLNQSPRVVLYPNEQVILTDIHHQYQLLLDQYPDLAPEKTGNPSVNRLVWQPNNGKILQSLADDLQQLAEKISQRTIAQYQVHLRVSRRDRLLMLGFGIVAIAIVVGLSGLTVKLIEQQNRLVRNLKALARTDGLTGIANRRVWDEELNRSLERARRTRLPLTVAVLDLDYFKRFNDSYGHQAGDALLRDIARLLKSKLREGDIVARYGGEEFAMLLHGCSLQGAAEVIARIRPLVPYGQTFSVGVTDSDGFESGATVVARADSALYRAKDQGRNCTVLLASDRRLLPPTRGVDA